MGDILHLMGHWIMIMLHNTAKDQIVQQDICVYWELLPVFGLSFSSVLLFSVAIDRLLAVQKFYRNIVNGYKWLYTAIHIGPALVFAIFMEVRAIVDRTDQE
ncbi:hypothetical protein Y032_0084g1738 [Ancylostoma ceylanicum]|uniref:G-protein coupled receptors family 1 profile domain-containing protein n=1 Tax=Ancylostoma ceylanicum TaxID=53326 RepID=A0A016TRJ7_9BILA|nr:hypothetical protein Y032_0084g1738 [Ancylostoma ceylanicum]